MVAEQEGRSVMQADCRIRVLEIDWLLVLCQHMCFDALMIIWSKCLATRDLARKQCLEIPVTRRLGQTLKSCVHRLVMQLHV